MFTGIIEDLGCILKKENASQGMRLAVRFEKISARLKIGESIAVNGVCLTAAKIIPRGFEADVVHETLKATTLGQLEPGAKVHLERALRFGDRMGGHSISGHVDGRGQVIRKIKHGREQILFIRIPARIQRFCTPKGSVTVDGVSLTLQGMEGRLAKIALIPHTLKVTTLGTLREGDEVNIEADRLVQSGLNQPAENELPARESASALKQKLKALKRQGF